METILAFALGLLFGFFLYPIWMDDSNNENNNNTKTT